MLVTFGPEISEFTLLTIAPFAAIGQKFAYHVKYLRMSWTYLDLFYMFGRRIGRNDYPNISLAVSQGTLLWQPVKFGGCSQTSQETFALAFDNGLDDLKSTFKRLNGNIRPTLYTDLVRLTVVPAVADEAVPALIFWQTGVAQKWPGKK